MKKTIMAASIALASLSSMIGSPVLAASPNLGAVPMTDTTVFDQFGGKPGLVKLMDDFMVNLLEDERTRPFFDNNRQAGIKVLLVEQICEVLGGPCVYPGRDMKSAHTSMKVNRAAFNALVEDLQKAMDKNEIPFSAQNKLLAKLAPMYRDVEGTEGDAVAPNFPK